jgi:nucleoside-diphosphate-sugar epimerase
MARVLVIGGNLFIGRSLVERLLARGDDVVIMHRGKGTPFGNRVGEIQCDRNDTQAVQHKLSGETFDVAFDNVYDWQRGTSADQVHAAVAALRERLQRYVFTSSVAVYPHGGPYDEDAQLVSGDDPNQYARQKAETERALFALHERAGTPVATIRPAFIYGPNNPFDREAFFWDRILAERPIILPDGGTNTMQFVHVDDVAEAAVRAATDPRAIGRAYNLANPRVTQREFVETLARVAGRTLRLVSIPRATIHKAGGSAFSGGPLYFGDYLDIPPITVSSDRVREELGLTLRPLEDGLRHTFEWYRGQKRERPDFTWEDRLLTTIA